MLFANAVHAVVVDDAVDGVVVGFGVIVGLVVVATVVVVVGHVCPFGMSKTTCPVKTDEQDVPSATHSPSSLDGPHQ